MNVYDTANRLARELRMSNEYLEYKRLKEQVEQNPDVKAKIQEFEKKRYEVQLEAIKGEEQYRKIERKIICEEYMEDNSGGLLDYKLFCFGGKVKIRRNAKNICRTYGK